MTAEHRQPFRRILVAFGLRVALGLNPIALVTLAPTQAGAQSASDSATAQALFDRGKALMSAGKYTEACPAFEESERIEARSGTLLNLAACYEQMGRLASAWSTFLEAAALAKATGNADRERGARERAAALAPQLSNLTINAPSAVLTPGLEISRDGRIVGAAQLGLALPANAGAHVVSAKAPGRKPWRTTVTVRGGASTTTVDIPDLESDAVVAPAVAPALTQASPRQARLSQDVVPTEPVSGSATPSRISGGVIAGGIVTGAFAVGTVVTSVLYGSKLHDYNAANDSVASNAEELRSQAKTLGVANLVLLGGTLAAAGVTIYLWTQPTSDQASQSACLELRSFVGPERVGLSLGGSL